jgi:hypothetical protein
VIPIAASNFLEAELLKHSLAKATYTKPTKVYIALATAKPTKETTGATVTEPSYTGYKREEINSAELEEVTGGASTATKFKNKLEQKLPLSSSGSAKIKSWMIADSGTTSAGNSLYYGDFAEEFEVSPTVTTFSIAAKSLEISAE